MLAAIGVSSIEELFADIPAELRLDRPLALDSGRSELEVFEELRALAARNVSTQDEISFLGAGMYDHYVPSLIDSIIERSEFLTPYTPYQPEISQGGLQVMFEYQSSPGSRCRTPRCTRARALWPRPVTWPSSRTRADVSSSRAGFTRTRVRL
jgi:glycine cleavage system pyridoxal-binding protein P